jgi:hypothetical protein
MQEKDLVEA